MDDVRATLRSFYQDEMKQRASRPLGDDRTRSVHRFVAEMHSRQAGQVLEIGCGAGRDGVLIRDAGAKDAGRAQAGEKNPGWEYIGVDLSAAGVRECRDLGLNAIEADATDLPFPDDSFDAVWSMSTLMHLPGEDFATAVEEAGRVSRPGGLIEIGVWGSATSQEWTSPDGRYFRHRTDDELRKQVERLGVVEAFETWAHIDDGGHYQWLRIIRQG